MLQTKALYNLLRLNAAEDSSIKADPWALEDLRLVELDELLHRLAKTGVQLDRKSFFHFGENCDTPEELTDLLLPDDASDTMRDPFYLVVFELWRRIIPEKQSLSIFCDELDHRISLYDRGDLDSDEPIQDALANFLEILDENTDSGADPEEIFSLITEYCAHDLESFIYDYVSDLLDSGNSLYASELVEGFSPYVSDPLWFDFLRIRLVATTDISEANLAMQKLLDSDLDPALLLEAIRFLSANGDHDLFKIAVKKALPELSSQEELLDVVALIADFYRRLDEDEKEKSVQKLLIEERHDPLSSADVEQLIL